MNNPEINYKTIRRKHIFFIIMTAIISFGLSCFVISPIYVHISTNIVYRHTFLPKILELLISILDITVYSLCFSTIIYSIYRIKTKKSLILILSYCIAVLAKYIANILIQTLIDGIFPTGLDIILVVFNYLFELIMLSIIICIASSIIKKNDMPTNSAEFIKLLSFKNPLQCAALSAGIILCAIKVFTRILFDISYGAPTSTLEILWMIIYYISDILICPIVYFVSLFVITHHEKQYQNLINKAEVKNEK